MWAKKLLPGKLLSFLVGQTVFVTGSSYNKRIEVRQVNCKNMLLVNGIQQSGGYTEGLWKKGLKGFQPKNVLVFGVGGGTIFRMFPNVQIIGVDIDKTIIDIAKKYFGLQHAILIEKDARSFHTNKKFDLVIIDLFIGNDVPAFATSKTFLRRAYGMLSHGGTLIMNFYDEHDQRQKAEAMASWFRQASVKPVLRNMFLYVVK